MRNERGDLGALDACRGVEALGEISPFSMAEVTEMLAHVCGYEELHRHVSVTFLQLRLRILAHKGVLLGAVVQAASRHQTPP